MIIRNDDVSGNTDRFSLERLYKVVKKAHPDAEIWSCVTFFSKHTDNQSVYAEVPFKRKPLDWFYDVDTYYSDYKVEGTDKYCSHGLLHIDHSKAYKQTQELSILTSCKLLKTDIFVPPFNRFNEDTIDICKNRGIKLVGLNEKWKSFEYNSFNPDHEHWYFHSWKWERDDLKKYLCQKQLVQ